MLTPDEPQMSEMLAYNRLILKAPRNYSLELRFFLLWRETERTNSCKPNLFHFEYHVQLDSREFLNKKTRYSLVSNETQDYKDFTRLS